MENATEISSEISFEISTQNLTQQKPRLNISKMMFMVLIVEKRDNTSDKYFHNLEVGFGHIISSADLKFKNEAIHPLPI